MLAISSDTTSDFFFKIFDFLIEQVIDGLDKTVASMKKGEVAVVRISPEYGFGGAETKRDLGTVPPNSTLIYELELVEFSKVSSPRNYSKLHIVLLSWKLDIFNFAHCI